MIIFELRGWRTRLVSAIAFSFLVPFAFLSAHTNGVFEQMFLKAFYYDFKLESFSMFDFEQHLKFSRDLEDVQRIFSPYQIIDILPEQTHFADYLSSGWSLYLDHQPQFSSDSASLYHETMVFGGLCATRWNAVRARCTLCEEGGVVQNLSLDEASGAVQAETCEHCGGYIKTFFQGKDIQVDPVADDLGSLALDILAGEQGYARAAPNLFLKDAEVV